MHLGWIKSSKKGDFFVVVGSPYILVYNAFWLALVASRRTICDEMSEI